MINCNNNFINTTVIKIKVAKLKNLIFRKGMGLMQGNLVEITHIVRQTIVTKNKQELNVEQSNQ